MEKTTNHQQMKNFFIDECYYETLQDFFSFFGNFTDHEFIRVYINSLNDTWSQEIEFATEEKMFVLGKNEISDVIFEHLEIHYEDRFPCDNGNESATIKRLQHAIASTLDIETLNHRVPTLFYPNGKYGIITKRILIEYFELDKTEIK